MLAGYGIVAVVVVVPFLLLLPLATGDDYIEPEDANTAGTYAVNSTFEANLDSLAAALIANASATPAGFATGTAGTAPDKVFAMALCRGDTNASSCGACARAAFVAGKQSNPGNKGVAVYKDACTIRYSGRQQFMNFIRQEQWQVSQIIWNIQRAATSVSGPAAGWFNASVTKILTALVEQAADAAGNSTTKKYFATGEEDFVPKIYGLAQCLPDLVKEQCHECLKSLHNSANLYMRDSLPKWIVTRSLWCSLWYSARKFYDGRSMLQLSAPPPPPPADTPVVTQPGEEKKKSTTTGLEGQRLSRLSIH
ncbi:hypothetical protein GUJ93_ZPchr0007g4557 [Zizania palustris]|uniref:Gnk2-homologous domain-containing protein n=1 Tax=Zizania palustris TaxID=103762 RepID=A0A8J5TEB4_ZIZPA|nr:hypothetical protein GUJ93_ZPchr0007g4557 [Zizania palustris]